MANPARIYVSVPADTHLDNEQLSLKNAILEASRPKASNCRATRGLAAFGV
jgi:hypothetical protein